MAFDAKGFMNAKLVAREEDVPVPALSSWFGDDEQPSFKVRGLSGNEFAKCQFAADKHKTLGAFVGALGTQISQKEMQKLIEQSIGLSDDKEPEIIKRLEMLVAGSVAPKIGLDVAVKLCEKFPVEFYQLTTAITKLTGLGAEEAKKKPKSSGTTQASEPA